MRQLLLPYQASGGFILIWGVSFASNNLDKMENLVNPFTGKYITPLDI